MRIIARQLHGKIYELEIEPSATFDEVKLQLISKYGLPNGAYTFIYQGSILHEPAPFSKLSTGSVIVFVIKNINSSPIHAQIMRSQSGISAPRPSDKAEHQVPRMNSSEQMNNAPPKPAPSPLQPAEPQKEQAPEKPPSLADEELSKNLQVAMEGLLVQQAYKEENSLWRNPDQAARVADIITSNPHSAIPMFRMSVLERYSATLSGAGVPLDVPALLLGVDFPPELIVADDYEAEVQQMSNAQRAGFNVVLQQGFEKRLSLQTYIECKFDPQAAIAKLKNLVKK